MDDLLFHAEAFVLGSILLEPELIHECKLQEEMFTDERHGRIMNYFRFLEEHDREISLLVMAETSGKNLLKIGGIEYLSKLASSVPSAKEFEKYQSIVRNAYIKRRASGAMKDLSDLGSSAEVTASEYASAIRDAAEEISDLADSDERDFVKASDVLNGHEKEIMQRQHRKGLTGAKTASADLDKLTGGHQNSDLIIVAARPSMGKTAFVCCDAIASAETGWTVAIFSIEMKKDKIAERLACSLGNIDSDKLRKGNFSDSDWERWTKAMDALDRLPIYIDDTPDITLQQIGAKVKRLKKKFPRLIVYVDFLQIVNPGRKFSKEHEGIAYVSKGLKRIARKNNCPVVAISAVGRDCEKRQDKRPMMSDLRESGSIESDADVVIFLYRDEYYNPESTKKGIVELIVAKGRNVGTGLIEMVFNKKTGRFLNIDWTQRAKEAASGERKENRNR